MSTDWLSLCQSPAEPPLVPMGPPQPPWEGWGPRQGLCHHSQQVPGDLYTSPAQTPWVRPSLPIPVPIPRDPPGSRDLVGPRRVPREDLGLPLGHGDTASPDLTLVQREHHGAALNPRGSAGGAPLIWNRQWSPSSRLHCRHSTAQMRVQGAHKLTVPRETPPCKTTRSVTHGCPCPRGSWLSSAMVAAFVGCRGALAMEQLAAESPREPGAGQTPQGGFS